MRSRLGLFALLWLVFFGLFASTSASAFDESLSFRRTSSGSIEAVVSGLTDTCGFVFLSPAVATIQGSTISIISPDGSGLCSIPIYPPRAYSVATDLGILPGESYQVVWSEAVDNGTTLQLSATLTPAAITGGAAMPAPALSWIGLAVLALMLGVFAGCQGRPSFPKV